MLTRIAVLSKPALKNRTVVRQVLNQKCQLFNAATHTRLFSFPSTSKTPYINGKFSYKFFKSNLFLKAYCHFSVSSKTIREHSARQQRQMIMISPSLMSTSI